MPPPPIDWNDISGRFQKVMHQMTHDENWSGTDFYAEALRRTFGYRPAGEQPDGQRALPNERLTCRWGLTTQTEADYVRDAHTYADRSNREKAEEQVKQMRAEVRRVYREAGKDFADMLRGRCNERTVTSRYRREGVAWAADMIDTSVPKDQFGYLREPESGSVEAHEAPR